MAAPKTTINDVPLPVLEILNAVNKWAYSSRNIATVALKAGFPRSGKVLKF
jgi:hypothetical protein